MKIFRNIAIVIVLCIIGYSASKFGTKPGLVLNMPTEEEMKDAVAAKPAPAPMAPLKFRMGGDDKLKDALAAGPIVPGPASFNPAGVGTLIVLGNGNGGGNPPPRGNGGYRPAGVGPTPPLSPSEPPDGCLGLQDTRECT